MGQGYTFRPAIKEAVGLLIGLAGASGSGKTYSALRLASGIVGKGNRFAVIDTEARRSLHYAEMFDFDMCELHPKFRPDNYAEAIIAADKAGYKVIVVDSMSHEWAGEGGVIDFQDEELDRMAGTDNWQKREACKMAAWIKPKTQHKMMVQKLLQVKATLILCFRAEEKVKMDKDDKGKTVIIPIGWQPICEKNLPYELTVSFLLTPDAPGMPKPLKLQEQHKALFPLDKPINEESGKKVAEWAKGGAQPPPRAQETVQPSGGESSSLASVKELEQAYREAGDMEAFLAAQAYVTEKSADLPAQDKAYLQKVAQEVCGRIEAGEKGEEMEMPNTDETILDKLMRELKLTAEHTKKDATSILGVASEFKGTNGPVRMNYDKMDPTNAKHVKWINATIDKLREMRK